MLSDTQSYPRHVRLPAVGLSPTVAAGILMLGLTGCVSYGSSEPIKVMPADLARASFVSAIEIKSLPPDASSEFRGKLEAALQTELKKCAKGPMPLTLEVSIARLSGDNAAKTVLVGGSNDIRGSVQFVDPNTGRVVGDYDISRSVGGGGIIAAVGMAGAEKQSAEAFAAEVCSQAFSPGR